MSTKRQTINDPMKRSLIQSISGPALAWLMLLMSVPAWAQRGNPDTLPLDTTAINYVDQGKYFLEIGNPELALDAFRAAFNRPTHQLSSTALYLWGLSAFRQGNMAEAELIFRQFLDVFPVSRYTEDCRYHLARSMLDSWQDTAAFVAFSDLLFLKDSASTVMLRRDADKAIQHFMYFDAEDRRMEYIIERLPLAHQLYVLDALAYRYYQDEKMKELSDMYNFFKRKHNYYSPFIERMFSEEKIVRYVDPGILKIALVFPADVHRTWRDSTEIPRDMTLPLDYFEGLLAGLEEYIRIDSSKIYLEVFDSRSRTDTLTAQVIAQRLDVLKPDLVIGDIYNTQSRILAEWSEANQTPQVVPLSPSGSLAQGKTQVFVAHPSPREHGQSMALYANGYLNLKKVAVFRDGTNSTEQLAYAFKENFETLGGEVVDLKVPSEYDKNAAKKIVKEVRKLSKEGVKGVYIPIQGNEESAGLILSQMKALDYNMKVMGGPHWWNRYKTVDRELKNSYGLICSSSDYVDEQNPEYQNFFKAYLQKYQYPPSRFCVQGYDMGLYLMELIERYPHGVGDDLAHFIRTQPPFYGLHQKIDFRGQQVNQSVNLLQFRESGTECLNCKETLGIQPLFQVNDFEIKE